jgi:hypothetical protein
VSKRYSHPKEHREETIKIKGKQASIKHSQTGEYRWENVRRYNESKKKRGTHILEPRVKDSYNTERMPVSKKHLQTKESHGGTS